MSETAKKKYKVTVDTGGSSHVFETTDSDVSNHFINGHEPMINFMTTDRKRVSVPGNFMVIQEEIEDV